MLWRIFSLLIALVSLAGNPAAADGLKPDDAGHTAIKALDSRLFQAYNDCDLQTLASLVDENLEFYHDKSGLSVGKNTFIEAIKKTICHKVRRELVPATLEVFPLESYGAIELGQHTFCNLIETPVCKPETNGSGRFFMLWQKQGDHYRLTRVFSYDHLSDWQRPKKART
jgi:hypothetical protein